jgi:hypothetical protein
MKGISCVWVCPLNQLSRQIYIFQRQRKLRIAALFVLWANGFIVKTLIVASHTYSIYIHSESQTLFYSQFAQLYKA